MNLATHLKVEGAGTVKELAKSEGITVRTLQNWWNDKEKHILIDAAIKRHKAKK